MSESEKKVYKIWCDAFKREDISVEDNFKRLLASLWYLASRRF